MKHPRELREGNRAPLTVVAAPVRGMSEATPEKKGLPRARGERAGLRTYAGLRYAGGSAQRVRAPATTRNFPTRKSRPAHGAVTLPCSRYLA